MIVNSEQHVRELRPLWMGIPGGLSGNSDDSFVK